MTSFDTYKWLTDHDLYIGYDFKMYRILSNQQMVESDDIRSGPTIVLAFDTFMKNLVDSKGGALLDASGNKVYDSMTKVKIVKIINFCISRRLLVSYSGRCYSKINTNDTLGKDMLFYYGNYDLDLLRFVSSKTGQAEDDSHFTQPDYYFMRGVINADKALLRRSLVKLHQLRKKYNEGTTDTENLVLIDEDVQRIESAFTRIKPIMQHYNVLTGPSPCGSLHMCVEKFIQSFDAVAPRITSTFATPMAPPPPIVPPSGTVGVNPTVPSGSVVVRGSKGVNSSRLSLDEKAALQLVKDYGKTHGIPLADVVPIRSDVSDYLRSEMLRLGLSSSLPSDFQKVVFTLKTSIPPSLFFDSIDTNYVSGPGSKSCVDMFLGEWYNEKGDCFGLSNIKRAGALYNDKLHRLFFGKIAVEVPDIRFMIDPSELVKACRDVPVKMETVNESSMTVMENFPFPEANNKYLYFDHDTLGFVANVVPCDLSVPIQVQNVMFRYRDFLNGDLNLCRGDGKVFLSVKNWNKKVWVTKSAAYVHPVVTPTVRVPTNE